MKKSSRADSLLNKWNLYNYNGYKQTNWFSSDLDHSALGPRDPNSTDSFQLALIKLLLSSWPEEYAYCCVQMRSHSTSSATMKKDCGWVKPLNVVVETAL